MLVFTRVCKCRCISSLFKQKARREFLGRTTRTLGAFQGNFDQWTMMSLTISFKQRRYMHLHTRNTKLTPVNIVKNNNKSSENDHNASRFTK